jgi:S1-C subfamily serine protease
LVFISTNLAFAIDFRAFDFQALNEYQIGSEWGKKPVSTKSSDFLNNPILRRAALATARVGGGTGFYLGKFAGKHIIATNHHVCPNGFSCLNTYAYFPLFGEKAKFLITYFYHTWDYVDLTLLQIDVPQDFEAKLINVGRNFAFDVPIYKGQKVLTVGFGMANNPHRAMVYNQDSDCVVFSKTNEFRLMADPDAYNPAPYKAWSFATGCDVSHGDSGSAVVDRTNGNVIGIVWTGKIPKSKEIQNSNYLIQNVFLKDSPEVWTELTYVVPAFHIKKAIQDTLANDRTLRNFEKDVLKAIIEQ